jgi:hypothetical protein
MIGFISTLVTISLNHIYYRQYSAIADLHTFQFTDAYAPGFPVFTSRLLATDLRTETITISLDYTLQVRHINKVFKSHVKSSQADLLYSSVLLVPIRSELTSQRQVQVEVTLRLTVSQSVSLGVEPHLGLMTRYLLLSDSYGIVFCGAPSLTRGRVCLLSESLPALVSHLL